jgi:hypothetical protein
MQMYSLANVCNDLSYFEGAFGEQARIIMSIE